jgi:hypothetical protein
VSRRRNRSPVPSILLGPGARVILSDELDGSGLPSLGYEHYDAHLRRLESSLDVGLAWTEGQAEVAPRPAVSPPTRPVSCRPVYRSVYECGAQPAVLHLTIAVHNVRRPTIWQAARGPWSAAWVPSCGYPTTAQHDSPSRPLVRRLCRSRQLKLQLRPPSGSRLSARCGSMLPVPGRLRALPRRGPLRTVRATRGGTRLKQAAPAWRGEGLCSCAGG